MRHTVSLWVTKDAGRSFRECRVPALTGYRPVTLQVENGLARITAVRFTNHPCPKSVAIRIA